MEPTSYRFPEEIMATLEELARERNTTIEKMLARAVVTEVFLDRLPAGTKLLVLEPNGKYSEVVRPEPAQQTA
jgi:hypothetical protein